MNNILNTLLLSLVSFAAWAQEVEEITPFTCGTTNLFNQRMEADADFRQQQATYERIYQQVVQTPITQARWANVLHTIPVVVHIVHNGAPIDTDANPTDEVIQNVMNDATQRFRHTQPGANTYTNPNYGADTEIEFCLATTDPSGNPTSGIIRHYDVTNSVGTDIGLAPALKTNYAWDETKYCNLFIVTDLKNANAAYLGGAGYDFTIYDSDIFWSGIIAHELGHYFSLRHPYISGSCTNSNCLTQGDFVCDTPPQSASVTTVSGNCNVIRNTCTTDDDDTSNNNPYRSTNLGGLGDQPDMVENYMDFKGSCWDAFTEGQKVRMKTNITANRAALVANTAACVAQPAPANDAGIIDAHITQTDICTNTFSATFKLVNYGTASLTSATVTMENKTNGETQTQNWTGNLTPLSNTNLSFATSFNLPIGEHNIEFRTSIPNGVTDDNLQNDATYDQVTYIGGVGCTTYADNCQTFNPTTLSGSGNSTTVTVVGSFATAGIVAVKVCAKTQGDINHFSEVFILKDENGNTLGTTATADQCTGVSEICFDITPSVFNAWAADGMISFDFDPEGPTINPNLCGDNPNQACIDIIVPNSSCTANLIVTDNPVSGTYQASNTIETSGTIEVTESATFKAGTGITLKSGFNAKTGSIFIAQIESCSVSFDEDFPKATERTLSSSKIDQLVVPIFKVYPNPMRESATIAYQLPESGKVTITIFNQFGQLMATPIQQQQIEAGQHQLDFEAANFQAGVYYLSLLYEGKYFSRKMVLLK